MKPNISSANNINRTDQNNQRRQNDKKQGFDVIWFYCYLKYFAEKQKPSTNQQQQQKQKISPSKKEKTNPTDENTDNQEKSQELNKKNTLSKKQQQNLNKEQRTQERQALSMNLIHELTHNLRTNYCIETIQRHSEHTLNTIKQRALLSRNDRFFVIEPEQEIREMEHRIRGASLISKRGKDGERYGGLQSCLEDMLMELYSYYLNSKNVYLVYRKTNSSITATLGFANNNNNLNVNHSNSSNVSKINGNVNNLSTFYEKNSISSSIDSAQNRLKMILTHNSSQSRLNTSKDSKGSLKNQRNESRSYGSLKSSFVRNNNNTSTLANKLLQEDSMLMLGNIATESFVGQGDKMDNKIQEMEIIDKFAEFDGLELWNIKYKKIPHTFIKFKKQSWTKCLNLPILHPSAPKTINELPIIPRLNRLNPSIDKLMPFVSLIKMLETYFPNLLPSIDSIYEYNGMPYVFLQEDNGYGSWKWETNIGVLCYFVVYGNDEETLSIRKVERWVEQNGETVLGRTIKEMTKRQKEKNRKRKEILRNISISNSNNNSTSNTNNNNSVVNRDSSNIQTGTNMGSSAMRALIIDEQKSHSQESQSNLLQLAGGSANKNQKKKEVGNPSTMANQLGPSLQMLITRDENSDLAIW